MEDSKKNLDGGPAFGEFKQAGHCSIKTGGISVRDYFAAKAMQGWTSNPIPEDQSIQYVAEWAYRQADAMLAARSEGEPK